MCVSEDEKRRRKHALGRRRNEGGRKGGREGGREGQKSITYLTHTHMYKVHPNYSVWGYVFFDQLMLRKIYLATISQRSHPLSQSQVPNNESTCWRTWRSHCWRWSRRHLALAVSPPFETPSRLSLALGNNKKSASPGQVRRVGGMLNKLVL